MKAVIALNKITIRYALLIWEHNINFFPNYDYNVYNNSTMPINWFENNMEFFLDILKIFI
jgi:hypothetical protein